MLLTAKQLLKLTARTQSGQVLGRVSEIEYDTEGQQVLRYRVSPARTLQRLVNNSPLIINRSQVVNISETELVVDDLVTATPAIEASSTVTMAQATNAQLPSVTDAVSS